MHFEPYLDLNTKLIRYRLFVNVAERIRLV
jgi:hypothetical protein